MSFINDIDPSWTLFLDRDGVINIEKDQDYIRTKEEFIFYPEVLNHFHLLNKVFPLVVVVTNQRGVGKKLMSEQDLYDIHQHLQAELALHKGNIHQFYYAADLENDALDRKPNIGMGFKAKADFPQINFSKSIMVGNNISDMEFGRNLGMKTVYLNTTKPRIEGHESIDMQFDSLVEFIKIVSGQCSP